MNPGDLVRVSDHPNALQVFREKRSPQWMSHVVYHDDYKVRVGIIVTEPVMIHFMYLVDDPQGTRYVSKVHKGVELWMQDAARIRVPIKEIELVQECP